MPDRGGGPGRTDRVAVALAGGFGAWWCLLALTNLPSRTLDRLRGEDRVIGLLPNYRLFAPAPVTRDVWLIYRRVRAGETDPGWEIAMRPTPRHGRHAVWHPEVRRDKALLDTAFDLCRRAGALPPDRVAALPSFRVLAGVVRNRVGEVGGPGDAVQFAVLRHDGYAVGTPTLAYLSDLLPVGRGAR